MPGNGDIGRAIEELDAAPFDDFHTSWLCVVLDAAIDDFGNANIGVIINLLAMVRERYAAELKIPGCSSYRKPTFMRDALRRNGVKP